MVALCRFIVSHKGAKLVLEAAIPYRERLYSREEGFQQLLGRCNRITVVSEEYFPAATCGETATSGPAPHYPSKNPISLTILLKTFVIILQDICQIRNEIAKYVIYFAHII